MTLLIHVQMFPISVDTNASSLHTEVETHVLSSANYFVLFIFQHWLFNHLAVRMRRNNLVVLENILRNFKLQHKNQV